MSQSEDTELSAKIVVVGDTGVGKTSVLLRQSGQGFTTNINPTLGASYVVSSVSIRDVIVSLRIWDTAGQERFRAMCPMYFRNARAAIVMYDLTTSSSFDSVKDWVAILRQQTSPGEDIALCIVGNKKDLQQGNREVTLEQGSLYAQSIGALFFETSAKSGAGVGQLFTALASIVLESNAKQGVSSDLANINLSQSSSHSKKKHKCCILR